MNTMKEKLWAVLVTSLLLQCFGEVDAYSVLLVPSPIAEVKEGNTLTLHCSYDGSNTPYFINWYLNNDMFGLVIETSSCQYLITPEEYDIDRYNISCHETKFYLSIASISKDKDHHATWECDTTVIGMHPLQKASTTIEVTDADKNGQSDEPKTVVLEVMTVVAVTGIVIVAVIALNKYSRDRKRRNDHLKNEIKKDHDENQEQMEKILEK